jgi:ribosome recycling factor
MSAYYWFDDDRDTLINDACEGFGPGWFTLFPVDDGEIPPIRLCLSELEPYRRDQLVKLVDDLVYGAQQRVKRLQQVSQHLREDLAKSAE